MRPELFLAMTTQHPCSIGLWADKIPSLVRKKYQSILPYIHGYLVSLPISTAPPQIYLNIESMRLLNMSNE